MWSQAAEDLLVGTALKESGLSYLKQFPAGPALGIYQVEPETHQEFWSRYLYRRVDLRDVIDKFTVPAQPPEEQLVTNLSYATAFVRLLYYQHAEPLPEAGDVEGLAAYWKKYFNTSVGKGTVAEWVMWYEHHGGYDDLA